jgi:hypothetical protein
LEQHERDTYLLGHLAPKPRKTSIEGVEKKNAAIPPTLPIETRRQGDGAANVSSTPSTSQQQKTPASTPTPMEGVEETPPFISPNIEADHGAPTAVAPEQEMPPVKPSLASPHRVEHDGKANLQQEAKGDEVAKEKNLALCGAVAVRPRLEQDDGWKPPQVTHEFGYPSDEEIVPNPKANFKKAFLPRLGHVRSWFKGAKVEPNSRASTSQEGARSSAPCLPIMAGKSSLSDEDSRNHGDISPRRYTDITARLPRDPSEFLQVVSRPGAKTWLKSVAL